MQQNNGKTIARCLLGSIVLLLVSSSFAFADISAPTNLIATAVPGQKVILQWKTSTDPSVVGYNIYRKASAAGDLKKLNAAPVKGLSYDDKDVSRGSNYYYVVKAVSGAGALSLESNLASAPNIVMTEKPVITHVGKIVKSALPGDSIEYVIDYTNNGFGPAKNVSIRHSVPKGTTMIPGSASVSKGMSASILYWDKKAGKWVDKIENEANISELRFVFAGMMNAVSKSPSGVVSFKVVVGL